MSAFSSEEDNADVTAVSEVSETDCADESSEFSMLELKAQDE